MHDQYEKYRKYSYLLVARSPKVIVEAKLWLGLQEEKGARNNPAILAMAGFIGGWIASYFVRDSIPWCGLFVGYVTVKCGKPFNPKMLSARSWLKWGSPRHGPPLLGDILVFWRDHPRSSKGHVGFYVGEDDQAYHVLGGNQGDSVSIVRISKSRLIGARKYYKIGQPSNVRQIFINPETDTLSINEA